MGEALDDWLAGGLLAPDLHARLWTELSAGATPLPQAAPSPARRSAALERKLGRGVTILVNLGAIILAAGLIIFFASNWVEFGRAGKIASLFILTLFFHLMGFDLTEEGRWSFPTLSLPETILVDEGALDQLVGPSLVEATLRHGYLGHRYFSDVRLTGLSFLLPDGVLVRRIEGIPFDVPLQVCQ